MTSTPQLIPFRYETPTVTLEVMGREAAVSRWSDGPVVQVLRFQLQIRRGTEGTPAVEIKGDRAAFNALRQAIQHYIQGQLTATEGAPGHPQAGAPYLESQGLTCHRLYFGPLKTSLQEHSIPLGTTQLADLGEVLEQLESQVRLLPVSLVSTPGQRSWRKWAPLAAGVVAAVGLSTTLWPTYQSQRGGGETALEAPPPTDALERGARSPAPPHNPPPATGTAEDQAGTAGDASVADAPPPSPIQATQQPPESSTPVPSPPAPAPTAAPPTPASPPVAPNSPPAPAPTASPSPTEPEVLAESPSPASPDTGMTPQSAAGNRPFSGEAPEAVAPETAMADQATDSAEVARSAPPEDVRLPASSVDTLAAAIAQGWQPPADLEQPLTYRLTLAADGTLTDIVPDDDLAAEYRDRVGFPAIGTPLLTPPVPPQVRVRLSPDGTVQVDPEV